MHSIGIGGAPYISPEIVTLKPPIAGVSYCFRILPNSKPS